MEDHSTWKEVLSFCVHAHIDMISFEVVFVVVCMVAIVVPRATKMVIDDRCTGDDEDTYGDAYRNSGDHTRNGHGWGSGVDQDGHGDDCGDGFHQDCDCCNVDDQVCHCDD